VEISDKPSISLLGLELESDPTLELLNGVLVATKRIKAPKDTKKTTLHQTKSSRLKSAVKLLKLIIIIIIIIIIIYIYIYTHNI